MLNYFLKEAPWIVCEITVCVHYLVNHYLVVEVVWDTVWFVVISLRVYAAAEVCSTGEVL